ncbi:MAG: PAS domain S-box protein, partial [Natronospirillum sp.]|uniref:ATP-binding protein n=1 Tax=Natronospirillum sp. TaxID=2812955 RepID=UPI0025E9779D
ELSAIAADRALSADDQIQQVLALGARHLDLDIGIVSRIKDSRYRIRYCTSPEGVDLTPGQVFDLGNTYCDLVLQTDQVLAINSMENSVHRGHPCYSAFGLEAYIGVSFELGNSYLGTVNFSAAKPRTRPFDDSEKLFVRLLTGWIAKTLEREHALNNLQLSESRLRALFELSPIGIALNDFETGDFVDVNEALLAPTGYTRDQFMALSYFDVTPEQYMDQETAQLDSLRQTGRYGPFEREYIRKDGSRYPVRLIGTLVEDTEGRHLIWSIIEDISERRRVEQMKNEFIATISHELRTPLTSIAGSLSILTSDATGTLPNQMQDMLEISHRNSQRLLLLVNDLLDMEKLLSGQMQFNLQAQSLWPILEVAVRDNQAYADQFGVRFSILPARGDPVVAVDAHRLQQVIANLLSNAAKFSPKGETVTLEITSDDGKARVTVHDRGPGIPASFQHRLFDKFSQVDASDRRAQGGTGLGLAISKELMEQMNGSVGFHSIEGQGSSFWLELPLMQKPA